MKRTFKKEMLAYATLMLCSTVALAALAVVA
jgi:hypothetical protein